MNHLKTMRMKARLPKFFSIKQATDLVRIGRDYDGGYLVSKSDIKNSDLLLGLGIFDDWSFEEDFVLHNDVEVVAYDASINLRFWLKQAIIQTIKNPFNLYAFKKFFSYKQFFKGKHKHVKKFVGLNSKDNQHCTFMNVLNQHESKNIFLKIDVEGCEYRLLDDIVLNQERISGMVIEMHDVDIHQKRIKEFIHQLSLNLVHVHANNYAPIRADDDLPIVLELTFSKYSNDSTDYKLPHKLDMPNNKNCLDYEILIDD